MSDAPSIVYLEADDEITSVVRRVRAAEPGRVVIVAPGRSRATSSVVALRLLARAGEEGERELAVVGDALTRSLAAEAGLTSYATVEDARVAATPATAHAPAPRHAAINVVRGPAVAEETVVRPLLAADTETRPVPVPRPAAARRAPSDRRRRAVPLVAALAGAGAILLTGVVAAATILPAATIRVTPRSEVVGPVSYRISVEDPERTAGTVTETAAVTATGTYPIQAAATGAVVFFNWNFVAVEVPAETLVAAGEQAFMTTAPITVPRGALTPEGTIRAGEEAAAVLAAAVGPAANVPAQAINQVLSEDTAARLRGFPDNDRPLVVNPEATAGGVDSTGVEFTQADLDAAVAALHAALAEGVASALEGTDEGLFLDPAQPPEPVITGAEGIVGTRDEEQAEISGELAYDRLGVDPDDVIDRATERFESDPGAVEEDRELLPDATRVAIGAVERNGDALAVEVTVTGRSAATPERAEIIERATGLSEDEARAALADVGDVEVDLWPGWVESVPDSEWRVVVEVAGVHVEQPVPSGS